jgi:hypothetical protein
MAQVDLDLSEFTQLAGDLVKSELVVGAEIRAIIQKGALVIKTKMQDEVKGLAHAPSFPSSITYETKVTATGIEAVIGPDKGRRQGALGNLLYYGSSKNGPVANLAGPLEAEGKVVENLLLRAVKGIL